MSKRAVTALTLFCVTLGALCLRLYTLSVKTDTAAYMQSHYKNITLDYLRLPVYDCKGELLCSTQTETYAAAKPVTESLPVLRGLLSEEDFISAAQVIASGSPVYAKVPNGTEINNGNIITLKKYVRYSDENCLVHLLGYTDSQGNGVSGIEKAFNSYLKTEIPLCVGFSCGADGQVIKGIPIRTDSRYNSCRGGIKLTVDKGIQETVEKTLRDSDIKKGAVLVCETKTGAIRAAASVPEYDRKNLDRSLRDADSPFINRVLSAYPTGSVFKVVTAAAALEKGISSDYTFNCTGSITVDGKIFHCNGSAVHGEINMEKALCVSCNCYFIRLAQLTGYRSVLEAAGVLGYGKSFEIAENLFSASGNLPSVRELESTGQLALFSFGQGTLTATAVQIANTFSSIGNGGEYTEPYAVERVTDADGNETYAFTPKPPIRAFSPETAELLRKMLKSVVTDGTAKKAKTDSFESAGKTATAQTGVFNPDKTEKLCTWFGGFFPADDPEYTVVIVKEDGTTGGEDCAPVYKQIAESVF